VVLRGHRSGEAIVLDHRLLDDEATLSVATDIRNEGSSGAASCDDQDGSRHKGEREMGYTHVGPF
tara:strand:+ start:1017 stop:1211 length:195 start_codon:yes stop_codon:yes gene_type:complete